jgi:hypothetical protein
LLGCCLFYVNDGPWTWHCLTVCLKMSVHPLAFPSEVWITSISTYTYPKELAWSITKLTCIWNHSCSDISKAVFVNIPYKKFTEYYVFKLPTCMQKMRLQIPSIFHPFGHLIYGTKFQDKGRKSTHIKRSCFPRLQRPRRIEDQAIPSYAALRRSRRCLSLSTKITSRPHLRKSSPRRAARASSSWACIVANLMMPLEVFVFLW